MPRLFSRSIMAAVVAVLLILFMMRVTASERDQLSGLERIIRDGLTPIQNGFTTMLKGSQGFVSHFADIDALLTENGELRQERGALLFENNQLRENQLEVQRLRVMLDFEQANPQYELIGATVIARGPSNWYSTLILNRGTTAGVEKNMVVIVPEGLIGRVVSVSNETAEVLLITDREGPAGAVVLFQENRIPGVVEGIGDGSDALMIKHIPYDAPVEVGQHVVTSGLGEFFPKGIRIGTVQSIDSEAEPSGLQKSAIIKPAVDFNRLEEVFIIKKGAPLDY